VKAAVLARFLGLASLVVAPSVLISGAQSAGAVGATFTVNSAADAAVGVPGNCPAVPAPNECRLRDAVAAAEANPGDNVITIAVGPIDLTFGQLSYGPASGTLTIDGATHTVTQLSGRVIVSTRDLTIRNVMIVGGGDAVWVASTADRKLTLLDATVSDSGGLGKSALVTMGSGSSITLTRSTITAGGAAVNAGDGSATVTDSSVTASSGGAISAKAGAIVTRSTVHGGAEAAVQTNGPAQITGSTISGGGGDGVNTSTDAVVVNSTITNNDGCGIAAAGRVALAYATVTANAVKSCAANVRASSLTSFGSVVGAPPVSGTNCTATSTSTNGYNYDDDGTCGFVGTGDHSRAGDSLLGALGAHRGSTQTRVPQIGSPLLDQIPAGKCGGPGAPLPTITTDQRGEVRPKGRACEIGAVEVSNQDGAAAAPPLAAAADVPVYSTVPTADPVVFFTIDDGTVRDPAAMDFIRAHNLPVTAFITTGPAHQDPGFFQALHALGASIQDHTITHPNLPNLGYADQVDQICGPLDDYQALFGERPWLLRPPYGAYNATTIQAASACGISAVVLWRATMSNGVLTTQGGGLRPGDIILMHFNADLRLNLEVALNAAAAAGLHPAPLEAYLPPGGSSGSAPRGGSKPGVYRSSAAQVYLRNSLSGGYADSTFIAGAGGDIALWCDWNNDGARSWGVYRSTNGHFYLSNENFTGARTAVAFPYGNGGVPDEGGDIPICGSWFGGAATVGVYRPATATFYLRLNNDPAREQTVAIPYGVVGDIPIVGHWSGSPTGATTIGVFRRSSSTFFLRTSNTPGFADHVVVFGVDTDNPIVGDWDASGTDTPGVTRPGAALHWYYTNATDGPAPTSGEFLYGDISDQPLPWK